MNSGRSAHRNRQDDECTAIDDGAVKRFEFETPRFAHVCLDDDMSDSHDSCLASSSLTFQIPGDEHRGFTSRGSRGWASRHAAR